MESGLCEISKAAGPIMFSSDWVLFLSRIGDRPEEFLMRPNVKSRLLDFLGITLRAQNIQGQLCYVLIGYQSTDVTMEI